MRIKFPTRYKIQYPDKNKKYYNSNNKPQIKNLLTTASGGYCMYCGTKILINNRNMGQIEHSIEKKHREIQFQYLTHCKYNMAIACPTCNLEFKKINILSPNIGSDYNCGRSCTNMCNNYLENYKEHCQLNKIILMPHGVKNPDTKEYYEIEYDLLKLLFIPSYNKNYTLYDTDYIQAHIDRFALNSSKFMPTEILNVCESFIQAQTVPNKGSYTNKIADRFIDYLANLSLKNAVKLCKLILLNSAL